MYEVNNLDGKKSEKEYAYLCIICKYVIKYYIYKHKICIYIYVYENVTQLVMSDSCNTMDCSPPGSSVHGILQARIL